MTTRSKSPIFYCKGPEKDITKVEKHKSGTVISYVKDVRNLTGVVCENRGPNRKCLISKDNSPCDKF